MVANVGSWFNNSYHTHNNFKLYLFIEVDRMLNPLEAVCKLAP